MNNEILNKNINNVMGSTTISLDNFCLGKLLMQLRNRSMFHFWDDNQSNSNSVYFEQGIGSRIGEMKCNLSPQIIENIKYNYNNHVFEFKNELLNNQVIKIGDDIFELAKLEARKIIMEANATSNDFWEHNNFIVYVIIGDITYDYNSDKIQCTFDIEMNLSKKESFTEIIEMK